MAMRLAWNRFGVGISARQLDNLVRTGVGEAMLRYTRRRRVERAQQLLTQTSEPIRRMAADVCLGDLHVFNKTFRRALGASPRQVRERG